MVLYKPHCDFNDCKLPSGQAAPSSSSTIPLGMRDIYFHFLPCWLGSPILHALMLLLLLGSPLQGHLATIAHGWMLAGFTFDLKYRWILISTVNSWTWLYRTVQMRTRVEHLSKRGEVTCNIIHCAFFFLQFFWLWGMEKIAIRKQKNATIKTRPTVYFYIKIQNVAKGFHL